MFQSVQTSLKIMLKNIDAHIFYKLLFTYSIYEGNLELNITIQTESVQYTM